jgi:GMP synthase-like glutamine amidotransferase
MVIRHHIEDSAGFIGDALRSRGAELTTHLFPNEGPLPDPRGADHLIVLGGVPSVNDQGPVRTWIDQEFEWLRQVDGMGIPVLGVCFGAQTLCIALGGKVVAAPYKEIGWTMVESVDSAVVPAGPWLEFHEDQCLPPPQATILARNEVGVQAFSLGRHLAVQFHPEVDGAHLQRWIEGGARQEIMRVGQDPAALLSETIAQEPDARVRADILVDSAINQAKGAGGT